MNAEIIQLHPYVNQTTLYPQCLQELLKAFCLEGNTRHIAEAMPYAADGMALVDILNVMARVGYSSAPIKTRMDMIDVRLLPCLFITDDGNALHVLSVPSKNNKQGTAYIFTKQPLKQSKEQQETSIATGYGWFHDAIGRFRGLFWKVGIISVVLNIVALGLPLFMMTIYDRIIDITTAKTIYAMGVGASILLTIEWTLRHLRSRYLAWFAARLDSLVSNRVLSRLLQLPALAIERASVASQISRLKAFESVRDFFTGPLFLTLLDVPSTLISLILLFIIGGMLGWVPIVVAMIYAGLILAFRARTKLLMFHSARARSSMQSHHIEMFEKLEAIKLNGLGSVWREQFRDLSAASAMASFRSQYLAQVLETLAYAIAVLAGTVVIYAGVERVWAGLMSGGELFASIILTWRVLGPLQTLCTSVSRQEQLYRSIQQINRLMELETERESAASLSKPSALEGHVNFTKVGLRYSKDSDPVFAGLSFEAKPGEIITIAGGNGSGKSTILKLALGLCRPQAGAVYFDNCDIRQIDPVELRKIIAYIPQIPELFEGTIAENIRFGNPLATNEEVWNAIALADATQEIKALPQGLSTTVSSGGTALPSSLMYRINLARAYVKDSPILLIDELPYAILNSTTGTKFIELLKSWHGKKTILIVSHRDDHIRMGDRTIGLLSGGRSIVGSPDIVIKQLRDDNFEQRRNSI